ncbi:MAG: hypothetical protein E6940_14335 [Clostridium septicum]|uniref:hypothetical protein n=1 Tax=Clostridium septicum TaxID=1504 RepID=UPI0025876AEE|nr:hypothetical protein [Clostridium septicum]MDU1315213.1 hypothetical protein [Clostridium septicum]
MKKGQEYRKKFYKAVNSLEYCSDTVIKNKHGVVMEKGITLHDGQFITYHLEDNTINFYIDDEVVLSIQEDSPLISMFEGLILSMNEE